MQNVRLAVTLGDPAGIGAEVALKAIAGGIPGITPVIVGRRAALERAMAPVGASFTLVSDDGRVEAEAGQLLLRDIPGSEPLPEFGAGSVATARESLRYIDAAIDLCRGGIVDAVVTGPVHKGLIEKSGTPFMGHTEYFAQALGGDPFMMMYSEKYRVILASTHIPVSRLPEVLTARRIGATIAAAHTAMRDVLGREPRIAVCGLDPHCGDNGAIGTFDDVVTAPAVKEAAARGWDVQGPLSADTLFMKEKWEKFDIVVAQYHDQGLIPFKMTAFEDGVNVTLGLPVVRTSVDHGTAFDIAGKGIASGGSMRQALLLAARLVNDRRGAARG